MNWEPTYCSIAVTFPTQPNKPVYDEWSTYLSSYTVSQHFCTLCRVTDIRVVYAVGAGAPGRVSGRHRQLPVRPGAFNPPPAVCTRV
ncbi:hypothetical protein J6590_051322 [Homalodisca vitripennis]|nr:hypothetical protein J6590_051322 [Homalodisca vitripennis]